MLMLSNYQSISMTSNLSIKTMPNSYKSFSSSMKFSNGDIGFYKFFFGTTNYSNSTTTPTTSSGSTTTGSDTTDKMFSGRHLKDTGTLIDALSDLRPADPHFREVLFVLALGIICVALLNIAQYYYYKRSEAHTIEMKKKFRAHQTLAIQILLAGYYGVSEAAFMVLFNPNYPDAERVVAGLVVFLISIPVPIIATLKYRKANEARAILLTTTNAKEASLVTKTIEKEMVFSPLFGKMRTGYGWYTVLNVYRRFLVALVSALLINYGYVQCWAIVIIISIVLFLNVFNRPQTSMREFFVELASQVLLLVTTLVPLIFYHTSGEPNEESGFIIMIFQICVMMICVALSIPAIIYLFIQWRKSKQLTKVEKQRQIEMAKKVLKEFQRSHDEPPPSFIPGFLLGISHALGKKPKLESKLYNPWAINFVPSLPSHELTPAQKRWSLIRSLVLSGEFTLIVPKEKPSLDIEGQIQELRKKYEWTEEEQNEFVKRDPKRWIVVEKK
eukprot:c19528_g1_i1.p1 GENE.c19528_g1_i1~~c19528_g1_i1.p1  ORF type:complete len:500 (+),score=190.14 c19528_g1_i1:372-1871(+)